MDNDNKDIKPLTMEISKDIFDPEKYPIDEENLTEKYKAKYKPEFCEGIIKHMTFGFSKESYAGVIGVSVVTLFNWINEKPEFKRAVEIAKSRCRLAWENIGIQGMLRGPKEFGERTWALNMFNRFGKEWRNSQSIDMKTNETKTVSFSEGLEKVKDKLKSNPKLLAKIEDDLIDK
jgi:hypothetical protein